jgi:tetratricopeptide (TPR) repeat protein
MVRFQHRKLAGHLVLNLAGLLATLALAACATTPKERTPELYESAADITNRAPSSMSIPRDGQVDGQRDAKSGAIIDDVALRTKADYHFTIAESLSLEGESAKAIEEYKLTLVYDPNSAQVRLRLAAEYVKAGLVSEAVEQCKAALETNPKHEDARLLLGGLYSAMHMYDEAVAQYKEVQKLNPENYEAPLFIGAILAEQHKFAEAGDVFTKLSKDADAPNRHTAFYYIGRVKLEESETLKGAAQQKDVKAAEAAFRQAMALKPGYQEAVLALGNMLETTGRKPQTIQLYQNFQEKSGPSANVAEELTRLYIEQKDYSRAYEQFAIMEAADKTDVNVKAKMAFILIEQQRYNEAITRLEDVLALEPSSDKIRFYLGAVFEETKDFGQAIASFQQIPVGSSYYKEAVVHTSYLYKLQNNYDKAIASVENGIKNDDAQPQFYALYASLLDDTKQYEKAVKMLKSAVTKFPDHAQLQFFYGSLQDRIGQKDESVETMKRVVKIDKNHVQALNFLAYAYADQGKNLDEAESLVRHAASLQPNDAYIMDTLGWVLFKKGKMSDAIRTLETAYKIQPDESVIAEHLGDAYYRQAMPEKAKKLYSRAAELDTNVAHADQIRAKVAAIDAQVQTLGSGERKPASTNSTSK